MSLARVFVIIFFTGLLPLVPQAAQSDDDGWRLRKVVEAYGLEPFTPASKKLGPKEKLGQVLFFDPIMGGAKNTACATCHIRSEGSVDGLPMAVGIGSTGVGKQRLGSDGALVIPRNVLPFFNRGSKDFTAFFWDGRVQLGPDGGFESPLGDRLPPGFENLLAVAATFPPAEPDEMLGRSLRRGGEKDSTYHAELVSDQVDPDNFQERTLEVYKNIAKRIVGDPNSLDATHLKYRTLFSDAYPNTINYDITHIGNALSAYISVAFETQSSAWDEYLQGDDTAISSDQKQGAMIFFGKGRCAVCHAGTQFSDFKYHGLAVPQLSVGKHGGYLDYGRAKATGRADDRFLFRTPPLRNVTRTGPWGHNGIFTTVEDAVEHHFNPVPLLYLAQQNRPREAEQAGRLLAFRSDTLAHIYPVSREDVKLLVSFLSSLESNTVMADEQALPSSVPSGMNQFILK
jgi:cytochrome c peroxidase